MSFVAFGVAWKYENENTASCQETTKKKRFRKDCKSQMSRYFCWGRGQQ